MADSNVCPVTGSPCNKPAVYSISEYQGSKSQSTNCCRDCAGLLIQERNRLAAQAAMPTKIALFLTTEDLLGNLGSMAAATPQDNRVCSCGCDYATILKHRKVGCQECYNTFYDLLAPLANQYETSKKQSSNNTMTTQERLTVLNRAMSRAVKEEDYEEAAKIRDAINRLTQKPPL